jgi:hypothetical protein
MQDEYKSELTKQEQEIYFLLLLHILKISFLYVTANHPTFIWFDYLDLRLY